MLRRPAVRLESRSSPRAGLVRPHRGERAPERARDEVAPAEATLWLQFGPDACCPRAWRATRADSASDARRDRERRVDVDPAARQVALLPGASSSARVRPRSGRAAAERLPRFRDVRVQGGLPHSHRREASRCRRRSRPRRRAPSRRGSHARCPDERQRRAVRAPGPRPPPSRDPCPRWPASVRGDERVAQRDPAFRDRESRAGSGRGAGAGRDDAAARDAQARDRHVGEPSARRRPARSSSRSQARWPEPGSPQRRCS